MRLVRTNPARLDDLLKSGGQTLRHAGIEQARGDARLLAQAALGLDAENMITDRTRPVSAMDEARFDELIERRAAGEPVSRILGRRGFWTLDLGITEDVLDPRADSETLIDLALHLRPPPGGPLRLLDLGTGSGCLLLALLCEYPEATGLGVDRSLDAARIAQRNAEANALAERADFLCADWTAPLSGQFDLVVCNPPYIPSGEISGLDREVALFDPVLALDGGSDGLDCYRNLVPRMPALLAPDGWVLFETGTNQARTVLSMMKQSGLTDGHAVRDLAGHERAVAARRV